jgi:ribosomal protein S18 acetylase RimI-like enzyme
MINLPSYEDFINESSNYNLIMKNIDDNEFIIRAMIGNKSIGELSFIKSKFKPVLKASTVSVDPSFRRKGIGSSMYQYAERELGLRFVKNDDVLTPDGKALWASKNKKFGND